MLDNHIMEALGRSKVTIENGKVTKVTEPEIEYCPIFNKHHNITKFTKESIKKNIEFRIKKFGMCTPQRELEMDDMLSVGISEILKTNVELKNIDCVVGVCDGVGTVLMTDPKIIQGAGGRVSGIISTTPIQEIIDKLDINNVLNPETAEINPLKGIEMAINRGYKNIAVTLLPSELVEEVYNLNKIIKPNLYLFIAHTTNVDVDMAKKLFDFADIITACASKNIRDLAEIKKPYYYGTQVPIYAISEKGKFFLDARLKAINKKSTSKEYPQNTDNIPHTLI